MVDSNTISVEEQFRRDNDPVYSLEKSKEDYAKAVYDLDVFVSKHATGGQKNPAKFVQDLQHYVRNVEMALETVQSDIERVGSVMNPGWTYPNSRRRIGSRRTYASYNRVPRLVFNDDDNDNDNDNDNDV